MKADQKHIQAILEEAWYGYIYHFCFNPQEHKLTFDVRVFHTTYIEFFEVEISEITTYLYNDGFNGRKPEEQESPYSWETMELTSLDYEPDLWSVQAYFKRNPGVKKLSFEQKFNIGIETWSAFMFLKANKIRINDQEFTLES